MGHLDVAPASTSTPHAKRLTGLTCALLSALALTGGCARVISGTPTTAWQTATDTVAGLPVDNGPSGPKQGAPPAQLPVEGTDRGEIDQLATNAVADVQDYWRQAFPEAFGGKEFRPVGKLISFDSAAPGRQVCGADSRGQANALYCSRDDSIAWDRGAMLPELQSAFGPLAVVTVLAHELGHAVQQRAATTAPDASTLVQEQQADCFTGAFFRHAAEGRAAHFDVSTGDGLNRVMGVLGYIRDTPGGTGFDGEDAHGSAFDRVSAFQFGFADGPQRCAAIDEADVQRRTTQFKFWKDAQEQDLPVDDQHVQAVQDSLQEVFRDTGARPPRVTAVPKTCPGVRVTTPAAYCPLTDSVLLSMDELRRIAQPPAAGEQESGYGDFAAYAQVASRYVQSVQRAAGLPLDDANAGLRTACMVGAWAGLLVEDPIGQRNPVGELRIAPGDVDEGVAVLLSGEGLIAADVHGTQVPAGFARVEAFRTGFQEGLAPCPTKYAPRQG